jgi:hypothetical protein
MSGAELTEWMAFYSIEPFGAEAPYIMSAQIAAAIVNTHRDPKKGKPLKTEEFVPKYDRPCQTPEQAYGMATFAAATLGGKIEIGA